jgi:hypothetical protein
MSKSRVFSFDSSHVGLADNLVAIRDVFGIHLVAIGDMKTHCQRLTMTQTDSKVVALWSPIVHAKIPGSKWFTAVQIQILFFLIRRKFATHRVLRR